MAFRCKQCGKIFESDDPIQSGEVVFCSWSCGDLYHKEQLTEQERIREHLFQQIDYLIEELNAIRWTVEYPNDAKEDSGGADANCLVRMQLKEVIKPEVEKLERIAKRWIP